PPFTAVLVGDTYKMRISNIKEMGGKRTTGGFFGTIFWLALIGANVLAGLLAAAPLLKVKAPQLAAFYANIAPLRAVVGVIVLAVGVGSFLRNLVFFLAPFADLLPQLAVVAAGLFLGKELIMQIAGGTKAADALAKQQAKIDAIERYQVPIGLACLVLAVIHLFFGGIVLF
ncbi:hypothetical protein GX586_04070, partial [bacterium]|nr:hypothetical protein [bacterium]